MLTDDQLKKLEYFYESATPGEWRANELGSGSLENPDDHLCLDGMYAYADADLIAAMRNALPELIRLARIALEKK